MIKFSNQQAYISQNVLGNDGVFVCLFVISSVQVTLLQVDKASADLKNTNKRLKEVVTSVSTILPP